MAPQQDATSSSSSLSVLIPVFAIVGTVCAIALVLGITLFYTRRRRQLEQSNSFSARKKQVSSAQSQKAQTIAARLALNRNSIYKSGIWQSVDLGRNQLNRMSHAQPPVVVTNASPFLLDGYEAAQDGYDPDAQVMTSFQIRLPSGVNGKEEVVIGLEEARDMVPDEDQFFHQEPEQAYTGEAYASAPSPLYAEFPAGERW
jgi:hypothetical protein